MENPYSKENRIWTKDGRADNPQPISAYQFMTAKIRVWNEGDANGYTRGNAEQAEIVSELVEAARTSLRLAGKGEQFVGEAALHASYVYNLIAKAKGE